MEAGFVLTGGTFDERLKSTRISLRCARPLSWRAALSKLMDSYRGQRCNGHFHMYAKTPIRPRGGP